MKTNPQQIKEIQSLIDLARAITHAVMLTANSETGEDELNVTQLCYAAECAGKADSLIIENKASQFMADTWENVDIATTLIYLLASAFHKDIELERVRSIFLRVDELLGAISFNLNMSEVAA